MGASVGKTLRAAGTTAAREPIRAAEGSAVEAAGATEDVQLGVCVGAATNATVGIALVIFLEHQ